MKKISILESKVIRNAGWLILGRIIQMGISLVVGLLSARYLGPSNYGLIGYAGAYTTFFACFCTLGINSILVKEILDHPEDQGEIIGTTIGLRAVSSFLSILAINALVIFIDAGETTTIWVVALSSLGVIFNISETFNYWFQSRLQSKVTAMATLIGYMISAAYKLYLIISGKNILYFAVVSSLDYLCVGVVLYFEYKKFHGQRLRFSLARGKELLNSSKHFILPSLMVAIYGQTDKLMLKQMISETEIGYYSAAVTICGMWCFVLSAIIDSAYPSIMEADHQDTELFEKRNRQLYAVVFYVSFLVSVGFAILSRPIVYILYGSQYMGAVNPLRIVTWYTAFSYLGVARNAWIVCRNKQKYILRIYVSAAITNVILNFIFIPLWGASGAAFASLVTEISTVLIVPFFIREIRRNSVLMLEAIFLKKIR